MKRRKHKRRLNHVLILTSDAADANVKQFRVRAWIVEVVVLLLCVLVGGVIGYFVYEGQLWENASRRSHEQVMALEEENKTLSEQNSKLEEQVTEQAEEIQILSDTVSQKVQSESELSATLEKQSLPTEFPLTGSASMEEVSPSTLGPINRPAMISPTTCGALHFLAMIPNTLANIIMIARSLKIL